MTPPHIRFFTNGDDNENKVKERLLRWCYGLGIEVRGSVVDDDSGGAGKHFDRAARAKLRRCRKPGDALLEPAFTGFLNAVFPDRFSDIVANRQTVAGLARVAILLPHIKRVDTRRKLSAQLISSDPKKTPERPVVSELRVRVLVQELTRTKPCCAGAACCPCWVPVSTRRNWPNWFSGGRKTHAGNWLSTISPDWRR